MDVTLVSATEQARLVASGKISATELLDAVLARHLATDEAINAVVMSRIDEARQAARLADEAIAQGRSCGPLHGVPVTVKEVFDWVGAPSTWGDPALADHRPTRNAVAVDRLIVAGAVVWGKTNVPLNLGDWQTFNTVYGTTNNPWDVTRTPGGSSGGSAAAVALGVAGLEIGSDIGGSIRFPAHYCGVLGHKPSFGFVSQSGHTNPRQAADVDINVCGPLARSAEDLALATTLLSDRHLQPEPRQTLADFTIGVMLENPCGGEQDTEMTAVIEAALAQLRAAGLQMTDRGPDLDHPHAQHVYRLLNHAATAQVDGNDADEANAQRYDAGARDQAAIAGKGAELSHLEWLELANQRAAVRSAWQRYFHDVDVLLAPVSASAAPPHQTDRPFAQQTIPINGHDVAIEDQWFWAGIASGSYLPSTVVPVGRVGAGGGLPVGVQLLAPFGHDLRGIRLAALIERELGGFVPPPLATNMADSGSKTRLS